MKHAIAYLRWLVIAIGYRIRPYDMLADQRRWWWQEPQRCLDHVAPAFGVCRLNQTPHWCITLGYEEAEIAAKLFGRRRSR